MSSYFKETSFVPFFLLILGILGEVRKKRVQVTLLALQSDSVSLYVKKEI